MTDDPTLITQKALRRSGLRVTNQRKTIMDVIAHHTGAISADEIYLEARQLDPRINLATVYRTLNTLKANGVINQYYLTREHERSHFELAGQAHDFHFHCLKCGEIINFRSSASLELLQRDLADQYQAEIAQVCLCCEGYCSKCSQALQEASSKQP